jgi:RNA polymerase sigma-70 factor (ECF subfamily)
MEMTTVEAAPRLDPDAALVAAARDDPRAFLALYDRYFERVLGYVRIRVHDPGACEDVTSEVFTRALAQLHRFRGDGSFGGWLFQIARNAVHDHGRRRRFEQLPLTLAAPEHDLDGRVDLRLLIRSLDVDQQHLLALRYGAGLSFDELAAVLGGSSGALRVRLHRLLSDLRKRYSDDD